MSFAHRHALPDGTVLNYQIDGPVDAPWVVFANSVMTDLHVWKPQLDVLSEPFRILRYDQRGHGQSTAVSTTASFETYGADLLHLLEALEIKSFHFVGLSMGVPTGLALLAMAPDRFLSFTAVDGVARSAPGREAFWTEKREQAQSGGMAALARATAERWLPSTPPDSNRHKSLVTIMMATPVDGFVAATHALQSYDLSAALEWMTCPFLGIAGALDGAMPDAMRTQFSTVAEAGFVEIDGAGHLPNLEQPAEFNATLMAFLNGQQEHLMEAR